MVTLKTDLQSLSKKEMKVLNESLVEACAKYMGKKKGLKVRMIGRGSKYFGQYAYEDNVIKIWKKSCSGMLGYVRTFVHEYAHSKQKGLKKYYSVYYAQYGYWNNPYEVDAREKEKMYRPEIWKEAKRLYKQKLDI
jgi:hypothetical protein